jgi:hypothetical protein
MSNEVALRSENIMSAEKLNSAMKFSDIMAQAVVTVPKHLQGKPADCLAITLQAMQWGMSPYAVGQKTYLVSGTLGYEAQLVNAVISSSSAIEGRFHYEYGGEWKNGNDPTAWVKVGALLAGESVLTWGEPLYPATVTTRNSPLWKTNPKQQAAYLALKYWARLYCPAVIMGVYTPDELQDIERDVTPVTDVMARLQGSPAATTVTPEDSMQEVAESFIDSVQSAAEALNAPVAPAPEPPPDDYITTTADTDEFLEAIHSADSIDDLKVIAKALQACKFGHQDDHARLLTAYGTRSSQLEMEEPEQ